MYDRSKPFNELPFLPPETKIEEDPAILKKLVIASRSLASVNYNVLRLPNPFMLLNTIALQEAKTSTEIENIFTTDDELYKAISDTIREERTDPATKEVLRYREALWAGFKTLQEAKKIDIHTIIKTVQKIKNTQQGIRPSQARVVIKRGQSSIKPGEIIYTPPRGDKLLQNLLDNLLEFLNDDSKHQMDPLIKMCIAHYQFEAIHPFQDGNGRAGRILNLLYLTHKGLLSHPTLYLSKYIILHKEDYYYNLGAVTERGSWKKWIMFMLDAVDKTSQITNSLIDDIIKQMESTFEYGKSKFKWYSKELNEVLFSQPYIKQKTIGDVLNKSSRTTHLKYINSLLESNILRAQKDGNEVYYLNDDLIRILEG
jgi:Fic family protein